MKYYIDDYMYLPDNWEKHLVVDSKNTHFKTKTEQDCFIRSLYICGIIEGEFSPDDFVDTSRAIYVGNENWLLIQEEHYI